MEAEGPGLTDRVRGAVLWRSGSQAISQLVTWASTFLVIRILEPRDYGLFAMTQVVLVFLSLMNGYGFANALVRSESISRKQIAQAFGMLLLLNAGLAAAQILLAPLAAAYFRQPEVANLLRVQAVIYLATPFIALPNALLSREIDFRRQGQVYLLGAFAGATTALGCAFAGLGVWTLVAAPIALFWTQAIGMTVVARTLMWPSFRFRGAGAMFRYGSAMVIVQFFWFIQSQSDVFIAGRTLSPHALGVYTTSLFLTQILSSKFIPALNDVAFAAYSKIQSRPDAVASAFLKAVRLIMLIALPFYLGITATAEPLVLTVLGPKWVEAIPIIQILTLAMPFMALQIMFAPANNALGRSGLTVRNALIGALVMPIVFLIGIRGGTHGMAAAWLFGFPIITAFTAASSLKAMGASITDLGRALKPGLLASIFMAVTVAGLDRLLPPMGAQPRLALLVLAGLVIYAGSLFIFARSVVDDVARLMLRKSPAASPA